MVSRTIRRLWRNIHALAILRKYCRVSKCAPHNRGPSCQHILVNPISVRRECASYFGNSFHSRIIADHSVTCETLGPKIMKLKESKVNIGSWGATRFGFFADKAFLLYCRDCLDCRFIDQRPSVGKELPEIDNSSGMDQSDEYTFPITESNTRVGEFCLYTHHVPRDPIRKWNSFLISESRSEDSSLPLHVYLLGSRIRGILISSMIHFINFFPPVIVFFSSNIYLRYFLRVYYKKNGDRLAV